MTKYFSLFFWFAIFSVSGALAQEVPCNLQITIFEFGSTGDQVQDVKATLTNLDKKFKLKPEARIDSIIFNSLNSGKYKIETLKDGFQRRSKEINVDCSIADKDGNVFENLYLWKGNAKEETKVASDNRYKLVGRMDGSEEIKFQTDRNVENAALKLGKPSYPAAAKAVRASGTIPVQVTIDEDGNVISAQAVEGHPLLRSAAVKAARQSKFLMTLLSGVPVKVTGIINYNFVAQ